LLGVQAISLLTLLSNISVIASVSSRGQLRVSSFYLSVQLQMLAGTWAFLGIPIAVCAGVAALYRMETPLRVFFLYLLVSFFFGISIPIWFLASGSLCDTVVTPEVQQMGSSFVCGFTDTFTFFWTLIGGVLHAYLVYIVWSAAEEISEAPQPELMKYSDALKNVYMPDPPSSYLYNVGPVGSPRSFALQPGMGPDPRIMNRSFGTFQGPPDPGMMPGFVRPPPPGF
jgi:hypothetical protein